MVASSRSVVLRDRDSKLYHKTFENYCRQQWGMDRRYADRHIQASAVYAELGSIGPNLPTAESQCRPLTKLEPAKQQEVWKAVVERGEPITAKLVKSVADELTKPNSEKSDDKPSVKDLGAPKAKPSRMRWLGAIRVFWDLPYNSEVFFCQGVKRMGLVCPEPLLPTR